MDAVRSVAPRGVAAATVAGVLAVVLAGAGCGRSHLFYDTRELHHAPLQQQQKAPMTQVLADRLHGHSVVWVDGDGGEHVVTPDAGGLSKLGLPELGALWLATSTGDLGGENDVRVQLAGKKSVPVSVLIALDGGVRVISPQKGAVADDDDKAPALSEDEIREKFGIEKKLPGKWDVRERRALTESLQSLSPEELALMQSLTFDRSAGNPDPSRAALYKTDGCAGVIYLFSQGVKSDHYRFVGDTADPKSAVLHSIVHEMGHAFEQSLARAKYCASVKARANVAKANDLVREGDGLADENPVLAGYLQALAGEPAPTDYGNTSPHESFAESFALFHVDPAALKRTRPTVYAWFASGGHVKAHGPSKP